MSGFVTPARLKKSNIFSVESAIWLSKRHHALAARRKSAHPLVYRHGPAQQISLHRIAAVCNQKVELLRGFHSFRHHMQSEMPCHAENGLDDGGIVAAAVRVLDKTLVDLEFVQRQTFKISEA